MASGGFELQTGPGNYDAAVVSLGKDGAQSGVVMYVDFDPDLETEAREILEAMVEMANFAMTHFPSEGKP